MDRYLSIGVLWNLNVVGGPEGTEEEDMEEVVGQSRKVHRKADSAVWL